MRLVVAALAQPRAMEGRRKDQIGRRAGISGRPGHFSSQKGGGIFLAAVLEPHDQVMKHAAIEAGRVDLGAGLRFRQTVSARMIPGFGRMKRPRADGTERRLKPGPLVLAGIAETSILFEEDPAKQTTRRKNPVEPH